MVEREFTLPFPEFRWRWASATPTENLNRPDIFIGVLGALYRNQGSRKSSEGFLRDLQQVEHELRLPHAPRLARDAKRNIIRNSGQYWKVLGVLTDDREIRLTELGERYATRQMSSTEFGVHTVLNHVLPSSVYGEDEREKWRIADLQIRPLLLILQVLNLLSKEAPDSGFLIEHEYLRVVLPLSSQTQNADRIARAVLDQRAGRLSVGQWPTVISKPNDSRMALEFMKFLVEYEFVREYPAPGGNSRYALGPVDVATLERHVDEVPAVEAYASGPEEWARIAAEVVDRDRVMRAVLDRPGQRKFRADVVMASGGSCLLTGTSVRRVLEAAHIRPAASLGSDHVGNGICLRSDIHTLFDANHIRIASTGEIQYRAEVRSDGQYRDLPDRVDLPEYVDKSLLDWRWSFV